MKSKLIQFHKAVFLFVFLLVSIVTMAGTGGHTYKAYGLRFYSFKESEGKRTSLTLNDDKPFDLKGQLEIQFEMKLRKGGETFGDILHIMPNAGVPVRMAVICESGKVMLTFINGNKMNRIMPIPIDKWCTISLNINAKANRVDVIVGKSVHNLSLPLRQAKEARVAFGFDEKISRDVPSINLRNVRVLHDGDLIRHWILGKHNDSICYDQVENVAAIETDGAWIIDSHAKLAEIFSQEYDNPVEVAVDTRNGQFLIVDRQSIDSYDMKGNRVRGVQVTGAFPKFNVGNAVVSPVDNTLMLYSIDSKAVSTFDMAMGAWTAPEATQVDNSYYNHARAWSPNDSSYYCFGGYGHFRYSNDLLRFDLRTRQWSRINYRPLLPPRYAAAATVSDGYLYVLGGRGNKEGQQPLPTYSYYTLSKINLVSGEQKQLWAMPDTLHDDPSFQLAATMIYSKTTKSLYAVCMNGNDLLLLQLSLQEPGWKILDKFHVDGGGFEAQDLCLYECPGQDKILLVLNRKNAKKKSEVTVFSISSPIMTQADIRQTDIGDDDWDFGLMLGGSILVIALLSVGGWVLVRRTTRGKMRNSEEEPLHPTALDRDMMQASAEPAAPSAQEQPKAEQPVETAPQDGAHEQHGEEEEEEYSLPMPKVQQKSFIQLLGEFRIFDCNGRDITAQCTPKLKELLLVVILNCEKERSGRFPAERISDQLWPDKEGLAARNNRNVSLRKLRTYLSEVGNIDISGNNSVISIAWNDVVCDYHEVMQEAKKVEAGRLNSLHEVSESTLAYLFSGTMLPDSNDPWLDDFKSKFSSISLDYLGDLLVEEMSREHAENVMRIADIMLKHDPFNESALAAKCRILVKNNKRGVAKNVYQSFCREYEKSMAEPFEYTFADIIGGEGKGWKIFK